MRLLLLPFSFLFAVIVYIRNRFYNWGIFKTLELNKKVISVGNISSGGTGKTPFVELIAKHILSQDKFAVIVLKGYKRESDDIKVAEFGFKNENHELNSENFGDEGLMLLENLNSITQGKGLLVVCDNKTKGAKFANSKFKPDVIILDDGFQHRKLYRDLDIVLISDEKNKHLLPAGNMREPFSSVFRSDIIVVNNKFDSETYIAKTKQLSRVTCGYVFEGLINAAAENVPKENISAIAFCGIGDPDSFKELLKKEGIKVSDFLVFPDHHYFSIQDIEKIINSYKNNSSNAIITTQKDFSRIKNSELVIKSTTGNLYKELLLNYPLLYAKIKMQISNNENILFDKIDELIS